MFSGVRVPILNEVEVKNRKIVPFHKRADKGCSIRVSLCYIRTTLGSVTLMGGAYKQISAGRKVSILL